MPQNKLALLQYLNSNLDVLLVAIVVLSPPWQRQALRDALQALKELMEQEKENER